jgi:signal transduction histidine kinase
LATQLEPSAFSIHPAASMFSISPRTTLILLFALAVLIFGVGLRVSRREEIVRIDRDRESLRRFSGELQFEIQRLETVFEGHLSRLARMPKPGDAFEVRRVADQVVGVWQFSLLHRDPKRAGSDTHIQTGLPRGGHTPLPALDIPSQGNAAGVVLLPRDELFKENGDTSGWIEQPGKPLMFWERVASDEVVVLMIDVPAVQAAMSGWLETWAAPRFEPVRAGRGPDQFRQSDGRPLLAEGPMMVGRPDLLIPFRSRLGSWELASWDRRATRVHYDSAALAAGSVLAALVALLGMLVFDQQRRAFAHGAQRVSFVNRVSHELRTPLTNILLNVDLASDLLEGAPEPARRLALVQEETRRLGRLIDNVLTFSRQEQRGLRAEARACVPAGVIRAVVEQFTPSFQRRALEVRCTGDLTAHCLLDPDALAQILSNLLSNVEKYAPGGEVAIEGALADGALTITVTDQGPGIPREAAERIFAPFERLDSRVNEGASGTGLGLAIARDLATAMGGSLRVVPSSRGASFELRVPAPPAKPLSAISAA